MEGITISIFGLDRVRREREGKEETSGEEGRPMIQCSNGIRIFAGASASTGSESEAELFCTSAELFCTSVVADAPGIDLASVVTGASFITGSPVVRYILDRSCCINRRSGFNRSSF